MLASSPITLKIFEKSEDSFRHLNKYVFPMVLLKVLAYASVYNKNIKPLSIFSIAPSRNYKSKTSDFAKSLIGKNNIIVNYGSDFTAHSLAKERLNNKCIFIDDGTVLFESKQGNRKLRLQASLAQLISEGLYQYSDKTEKWKMKGRVSVVLNMADLSFINKRKSFIESTFIHRFIAVNFRIPREEKRVTDIEMPQPLGFDIYDGNIDCGDYEDRIESYDFESYGLGQNSRDALIEHFKSLLKSHAALNGREKVDDDDYEVLNALSPFFKVPLKKEDVCLIASWNGFDEFNTSVYFGLRVDEVSSVFSFIEKNKDLFFPVFKLK